MPKHMYTPKGTDAYLQDTVVPEVYDLANREPRLEPLRGAVGSWSVNLHHFVYWPKKDVTFAVQDQANRGQEAFWRECGALDPK